MRALGVFLTVLATSAFTCAPALTPRQAEALHYLMTAKRFEMPHIGFGAIHSGGFLAMRLIARSPHADLAFKELVSRGTLAGQLYGLIGVQRTDPAFFRANQGRYARRTDSIEIASGDASDHDVVGKLVPGIASGEAGHLFLDPEESPELERGALDDETHYHFVR